MWCGHSTSVMQIRNSHGFASQADSRDSDTHSHMRICESPYSEFDPYLYSGAKTRRRTCAPGSEGAQWEVCSKAEVAEAGRAEGVPGLFVLPPYPAPVWGGCRGGGVAYVLLVSIGYEGTLRVLVGRSGP